jgi:hypothetical protein
MHRTKNHSWERTYRADYTYTETEAEDANKIPAVKSNPDFDTFLQNKEAFIGNETFGQPANRARKEDHQQIKHEFFFENRANRKYITVFRCACTMHRTENHSWEGKHRADYTDTEFPAEEKKYDLAEHSYSHLPSILQNKPLIRKHLSVMKRSGPSGNQQTEHKSSRGRTIKLRKLRRLKD